MTAYLSFAMLVSIVAWQDTGEQDNETFSGPQVGEEVMPFKMTGVFGEQADKEIDPVAEADGGPLLLIFVHKRERPAFGLSNALSRFAASKKKDGLHSAICYLTDNSPEAITWMNRIENYFDKNTSFGVSKEGIEGPGDYGLNRNVSVTILVAKDNEVVHNQALSEPNLSIDGQTVIDAICEMLEIDDPPKVTEFLPQRRGADRQMADRRMAQGRTKLTPEAERLVRQLINKQATKEQVDETAEKLLERIKENEDDKNEVGRICKRIVDGAVIGNYGTEHAQSYIKKWADEFGPDNESDAQDKDKSSRW